VGDRAPVLVGSGAATAATSAGGESGILSA
jgi:hypothetical protein